MIILTSLLITVINDKRQDLAYFSPKAPPELNFQHFFFKRMKCQHALQLFSNFTQITQSSCKVQIFSQK